MKLSLKLRRYNKAKQEYLRDTEPCCKGCGRYDKPLSISHTISRKRCEEIGKPELYYDKGNFELMCYGTSKDCHEIWESGQKTKASRLLNWDKMMMFVRHHDPERFRKIIYM